MKIGPRAGRSALCALLYVVLAVLLPGWHLVAHRADHTHAAGGLRYVPRSDLAGTHAHADHEHAHAHAHAHGGVTDLRLDRALDAAPGEAASPLGRDTARVGAGRGDAYDSALHGFGSFLHFAGAYLSADGSLSLLVVALRPVLLPGPTSSSLLPSRCSGCPLGARAPPVSSFSAS